MSRLYGYIKMDYWERSHSVPPLFAETSSSHCSLKVTYVSPNNSKKDKNG